MRQLESNVYDDQNESCFFLFLFFLFFMHFFFGPQSTVDIAMRDWEIAMVTMRALATEDITMRDWEIPTVTMRALA